MLLNVVGRVAHEAVFASPGPATTEVAAEVVPVQRARIVPVSKTCRDAVAATCAVVAAATRVREGSSIFLPVARARMAVVAGIGGTTFQQL